MWIEEIEDIKELALCMTKAFKNETPTVCGLAADNNNKIVHRNYDLLME